MEDKTNQDIIETILNMSIEGQEAIIVSIIDAVREKRLDVCGVILKESEIAKESLERFEHKFINEVDKPKCTAD